MSIDAVEPAGSALPGTGGLRRFKTRAQFQAVLAAGATVARTAHFALHRRGFEVPAPGADLPALPALPTGRPSSWLGAMLPKRWARRAVTRNAIRRQVYAVAACAGGSLPPAAYVVRLRAGFDRQHFESATSPALKSAVRDELRQLFARAVGTP